jgi:hypothetical protein
LSPGRYSVTFFIKKARRANFGLKTELPQISGSPNTLLPFYYMLPVFARPEACPSCYYVLFDAGGVTSFFVSAGAAGVGRRIVATNADQQGCAKATARPKKDTDRQKKAKRPTGKQKTAADIAKITIYQKTWMMPLQHPGNHGL